MEEGGQEKKSAAPPRIRPRAMSFDVFYVFVYALVGLACIAQFFLIVWPLIF